MSWSKRCRKTRYPDQATALAASLRLARMDGVTREVKRCKNVDCRAWHSLLVTRELK